MKKQNTRKRKEIKKTDKYRKKRIESKQSYFASLGSCCIACSLVILPICINMNM